MLNIRNRVVTQRNGANQATNISGHHVYYWGIWCQTFFLKETQGCPSSDKWCMSGHGTRRAGLRIGLSNHRYRCQQRAKPSHSYTSFFNNDSQKSNYSPKSILSRRLLLRHQNMLFVFSISSFSSKTLRLRQKNPTKSPVWCLVYSSWVLSLPSLASLLSSNNHHECNCWAGCPYKCHQHPRRVFLSVFTILRPKPDKQ